MNNDEKHRCDECNALSTELNHVEESMEEFKLCNDCYEDYQPLDEAERLAIKKDYLDQIAEDNYRDRQE